MPSVHQWRARFRTRTDSLAPAVELARDEARERERVILPSGEECASSPRSLTWPSSPPFSFLALARRRLRGTSGLDRPPSEEADESARDLERMLLDLLRDTVRRVDNGVARRCFFCAAASASSGASGLFSSSSAERASSSRLALLVRYAGRGRGRCSATMGSCSWCVGTSAPDCSPDSSSVVAGSLCFPPALPRCLDGAPPVDTASVWRHPGELCAIEPLDLDMILTRRLS